VPFSLHCKGNCSNGEQNRRTAIASDRRESKATSGRETDVRSDYNWPWGIPSEEEEEEGVKKAMIRILPDENEDEDCAK
jgi:hypothetical protein